jgi:hypothetical protein
VKACLDLLLIYSISPFHKVEGNVGRDDLAFKPFVRSQIPAPENLKNEDA